MKIKKLKELNYLNILIFLTILSIPLYQLRIELFSISVSILSIGLFSISAILVFINYKHLLFTFKKYILLLLFILLFIASFIPIFFLHPTIHGLGVLIEWIILPIVASFLLLVQTLKLSTTLLCIQNALVVVLFCVSAFSLFYLFSGQTTFDGRITAFYLSPNHLAMFIAPLIFIAIADMSKTSTKYIKLFSIITIIIACLTLFFTNSLSSSLAFLISLALVVFIKSNQKTVIFSVGILFILLFAFIACHKISNLNQNFSRNSLTARYEIWTTSIDYLQQNILLTTSGIDEFQKIYLTAQPFYKPYLHWSAPTPHNLILTFWVSGGFFTVLFFCLICSRFLYLSLISYQKTKNTTTLLYIAAFLTIIFTGILDTPYWKNDLAVLFWLLVILNISSKYNTSKIINQALL